MLTLNFHIKIDSLYQLNQSLLGLKLIQTTKKLIFRDKNIFFLILIYIKKKRLMVQELKLKYLFQSKSNKIYMLYTQTNLIIVI